MTQKMLFLILALAPTSLFGLTTVGDGQTQTAGDMFEAAIGVTFPGAITAQVEVRSGSGSVCYLSPITNTYSCAQSLTRSAVLTNGNWQIKVAVKAGPNPGPLVIDIRDSYLVFATFTLTVNPGAPAQMSVSPTTQDIKASSPLSSLFAVVTDKYNNPVPYALVKWQNVSGPTIQFAQPTGLASSDSLGLVMMNGTAPAQFGTSIVRATVYKDTLSPTSISGTYTINVVPPCPVVLSGNGATVPAAGGSGSLSFTAPGGCLIFTNSSAGVQLHLPTDRSIAYTVEPNPNQQTRTLEISVKGSNEAKFTITQEGAPCVFSVSPANIKILANGSGGAIALTASNSACQWTSSGVPSWIHSNPGSGTGSANISYSADQNQQATSRSATFSIGGVSISATQDGTSNTCNYTLSQSSVDVPSTGSQVNVSVNATGSQCTWTIVNTASWLQLNSNFNQSGSAPVSFTALANPGAASRSAVVTIAGQNLTVTQQGLSGNTPLPGIPTRFVSMTPCRLMETRQEYNYEGRTGLFGPPALRAGETRILTLPSSTVCIVPSSARAFALNVTVIPKGALDSVTVFPGFESRPDFWTVRSLDGLIVANSAIVKAGSAASISVYASNETDMIIDIVGYFTDDAQASNSVFYPLTPCRVIETRVDYRAPGPFGAPQLAAGEARRFQLPQSTDCRIPSGATAYSMTVTVVPPQSLPYLTVYPGGTARPNVSSMNSPAGRILANSILVPAAPDGSIEIYAYAKTDVTVDINGYFGPDDGRNGMFFYPTTQCRVSNTADPSFTGSFGGPAFGDLGTKTIAIPASPRCPGLPPTAKAWALNTTVMPNGNTMPFLTAWPSGATRPNASIINAFQGQTVSSAAIIPAGEAGAIDVFAYTQTQVALEVSGYFGR